MKPLNPYDDDFEKNINSASATIASLFLLVIVMFFAIISLLCLIVNKNNTIINQTNKIQRDSTVVENYKQLDGNGNK